VLLLRENLQAELRLCLAYRVAFHADLARVGDDSLAYFADGPGLVELKHGFPGTSLGVTRVAESVGEVTYVLSATAVSPQHRYTHNCIKRHLTPYAFIALQHSLDSFI
jgi:hypothetical protein